MASFSVASAIKVAIIGDDKLSKQLNQIHGRIEKFGTGIAKTGANITRAVGLPLAGIGAMSVKAAMDMNQAMARVATLIPGNTKRVQELKKAMQNMAVATGESTESLTSGLYDAISAWGDSEETLKRFNTVVKAGQAGMSNSSEAMDLMIKVTENYGDTSNEAMKKVADLAFTTVKFAKKAPFADMATNLGRVVPLAKQAGVTSKEMFAMMATFGGVTGNVSEVSTQMASLYGAVIDQNPKMTKALKKTNRLMGTDFKNASQMMEKVGTLEFLKRMNTAVGGSAQKFGELLGRKEAKVIAFSLLNAQSESYIKNMERMNNSAGNLSEAHKEVTDGIAKQNHEWNKLKQRAVVFAQRIGDKLLPIVERLFDRMEPWLKKIENMDDATLDWYINLAKIGIVAGPLISTFGKIIVNISSLSRNFKLAKAGSKGLIDSINLLGGEIKRLPYSKMSKTSKFLKGLQGFGAVAGAAAAGYGIGTLINEALIEPHSQMKAEKTQALEDKVYDAIRISKTKNVKSRMKALKELQEMKKTGQLTEDALGQFLSVEGMAGQIASQFTGGESPLERAERIREKADEAMLQLSKSLVEDYKKYGSDLKGKPGSESNVNIKIENKSDNSKVRVDKTGQPIRTTNRGLVMDGI